MQKKVKTYVNKCNLCHKIKSARHRPYKEMRTALTLAQLWASIIINFIVKLLLLKKILTKVIYDLILTIVNWLIKKVRFLPYKEALNAKELTYIFLQNVITLYELSDKIISDRDKLFTLNF